MVVTIPSPGDYNAVAAIGDALNHQTCTVCARTHTHTHTHTNLIPPSFSTALDVLHHQHAKGV
jgi:hypothetical protein